MYMYVFRAKRTSVTASCDAKAKANLAGPVTLFDNPLWIMIIWYTKCDNWYYHRDSMNGSHQQLHTSKNCDHRCVNCWQTWEALLEGVFFSGIRLHWCSYKCGSSHHVIKVRVSVCPKMGFIYSLSLSFLCKYMQIYSN